VSFDLNAYLDRVGLRGESTSLAVVHRAHATTIVFENLDPSTGLPVVLDVDNLADKMVTRGRVAIALSTTCCSRLLSRRWG